MAVYLLVTKYSPKTIAVKINSKMVVVTVISARKTLGTWMSWLIPKPAKLKEFL